MYPENTRGTIVREDAWIAGLSALTDMKDPAELQTSRATRNVPLSEGEAIIVSGEQSAEKRTNNRMSAIFFIDIILPADSDPCQCQVIITEKLCKIIETGKIFLPLWKPLLRARKV